MLAGVAPIPASSGQVSRMRLNRGGNRQLNRGPVLDRVRAGRDLPAGEGVPRPQAGLGNELA